LPELVTNNPDGYKSVDYSKLTALLIEVNQAQEEKIASQGQKLEQQQEQIKALQAQVARIDRLEVTLQQLQEQIQTSTSQTISSHN
ncbi:MAG: hypothetical protein AAFO03_14375, partial [Bacteroidota bacterium]